MPTIKETIASMFTPEAVPEAEWKQKKRQKLQDIFMQQARELGESAAGITSLESGLLKAGDKAAAQKILEQVPTVEAQQSLRQSNPEAYDQYLEALNQIYGDVLKRAKDMGYGVRRWFHGTTVPIEEFKPEAKGLSTGAQSAKKGYFFASDPSTASDYAELAREKGIIGEGDKVTTRLLSETAELHNEAYDKIKDAAFERDNALGNIQRQIDRNNNTKEVLEMALTKKPPKGITKQEHLERIEELKQKIKNGEEFISKQRDIADMNSKLIKKLDDEIGSQGQNVIPVRLRGTPETIHVKNYKGQTYRDTTFAEEMAKAQAQGKEGVLFKNTYDPADPMNRVKQDIAAVFDPSQIRSEFAAYDPRFAKSGNILAGGLATIPMIEALRKKVEETRQGGKRVEPEI